MARLVLDDIQPSSTTMMFKLIPEWRDRVSRIFTILGSDARVNEDYFTLDADIYAPSYSARDLAAAYVSLRTASVETTTYQTYIVPFGEPLIEGKWLAITSFDLPSSYGAGLVVAYPPSQTRACPIGCPWCYAAGSLPNEGDWDRLLDAVRGAAERIKKEALDVFVAYGGNVDPSLFIDEIPPEALDPSPNVEGVAFSTSSPDPKVIRRIDDVAERAKNGVTAFTLHTPWMYELLPDRSRPLDYDRYVEALGGIWLRWGGVVIIAAVRADAPVRPQIEEMLRLMRLFDGAAHRIFLLRYHSTPQNSDLPLRPMTSEEIDELVLRYLLEKRESDDTSTLVSFDACLSMQLFPAYADLIRDAEMRAMMVARADGSFSPAGPGCPRWGSSCQVRPGSPLRVDVAAGIIRANVD